MSDESCGFISWRPRFLQRFANSRSFMVIFGFLGTVQAMGFVYFVATITTLEKRFQLPSQTMGILMSGNEISQILLVLFLSYLGGQGNRPLWIAWGVAISALSCYILASPHFFFGAGKTALSLTKEYLDVDELSWNSTTPKGNLSICMANREPPDENCSHAFDQQHLFPMIILFMSQFVLGVGTSLYFSLGQTYMDDNTKKEQTPLLLGISMSLRTLGPALGFVLGYFCLSLYIDPQLTPLIDRRDPRWMGAWWLGWVILGSAMLIFAFLLSAFPKTLPSSRKENETLMAVKLHSERQPLNKKIRPYKDERDKMSIKLFLQSLLRITKNPILMVNNFVAITYILGASGYMTFYNKYTETQFETSAARSNMIAAFTTIFSLVIGFLLSGIIISRFKPKTSYLLMWNIFIGCLYFSGEIVIMSLKCDNVNADASSSTNPILNLKSECNENCSCDGIKYSPVCNQATRQTYFSACHAGCTSLIETNSSKPLFTNCSCANSTDVLTQGPCLANCTQNFYVFIATICVMQMLGCTGRITNVLLNYRSVDVKDKSLSQGLSLFLISLFAFIPGPIIFGKIIDNACIIWESTCGQKGNCWLYDKEKFRIYLNATAACFSCVAIILDIALYFLGRNIDLYEEEKKTETETEK